MTVILTIVGLLVFAVSCFTTGFKLGLKRLLAFTALGLIIDIALFSMTATSLYLAL